MADSEGSNPSLVTNYYDGGVVELAYTMVLKIIAFGLASSSLVPATIFKIEGNFIIISNKDIKLYSEAH